MVKAYMKQKYRIRPDYEFLISVKYINHITAAASSAHTILTATETAVIESPASASASRNTRTTALEDQAAQRRDTNEQADSAIDQLQNK